MGLPNVGKSTLFNALVKSRQAQASNFPFCTIDPNIGIVAVPDIRLDKLAKLVNPDKIVPATVEFIDIAGLVKEAHKGEGLGNKFLSHIRNTDAICMVLRCFEDANITHVAGKINPKDDFETIKTELELADLDKETKDQKPKTKNTDTKIKKFKDIPMIYAANVSEKEASLTAEEIVKKYNLKSLIANRQSLIVISAKVEQDLIDLDEKEQKEYLKTLGLDKSGLDRLIKTAYHTLGLITFYTTKGGKELSAWAIPKGTKAPEAAGKIHTDFARGFIKAEVVSFADFVKYNGKSGTQSAGKMRIEGKDYIVQDGDVIEFKFNV